MALARLMLKAPDIVVLDEATAHLDSESEAAVQRALRTALAGRTSLVIAHRLSTVREADQLLVVDDGRIVERGTHASCWPRTGSTPSCTGPSSPTRKRSGPVPDPCEPERPRRERLGGPGRPPALRIASNRASKGPTVGK